MSSVMIVDVRDKRTGHFVV